MPGRRRGSTLKGVTDVSEQDVTRLADDVRQLREEVQSVRSDLKAYLGEPEDKETQNVLTELHAMVAKLEDCRKLLKGPSYA